MNGICKNDYSVITLIHAYFKTKKTLTICQRLKGKL
jgi:hypothetical protein